VHWLRNILARVRKSDRARVLELLRAATGAQSVEGAREAPRRAAVELGGPYPQAAQMLEEEGEQVLAVFHLPAMHRRRMASSNMLERLSQELRRRTRVVRIFPNTVSCLRLACALAIETNQEWMARR
jgi:transposase-like protein